MLRLIFRMIFDWCRLFVVEYCESPCLKAFEVLSQRNAEPLAIGRRLLKGERQTAKRFGQGLGRSALRLAPGARDEIIGADVLGPGSDFNRLRHPAPGMRVRGDKYVRSTATRQIGLERVGINRVVEDEKEPLALMPQPFHHCLNCQLLILVRADPAQPDAKTEKVIAQGGLRLRPNPPNGAVLVAMTLCIGDSERRLAHAPHPVQRSNGDATLVG